MDDNITLLLTDGSKIHMSKDILIKHSIYFERLFASQFKEATISELVIEENAEAFGEIINRIQGINKEVSWDISLDIIRLIYFYQMNDIKVEHNYTVPAEQFKNYVDKLNELFPEGLTQKIIDTIASKIHSIIDLSCYSDSFIESIFSSRGYYPTTELRGDITYQMLSSTNNPNLMSLVDYNLLSFEVKNKPDRFLIRDVHKAVELKMPQFVARVKMEGSGNLKLCSPINYYGIWVHFTKDEPLNDRLIHVISYDKSSKNLIIVTTWEYITTIY